MTAWGPTSICRRILTIAVAVSPEPGRGGTNLERSLDHPAPVWGLFGTYRRQFGRRQGRDRGENLRDQPWIPSPARTRRWNAPDRAGRNAGLRTKRVQTL